LLPQLLFWVQGKESLARSFSLEDTYSDIDKSEEQKLETVTTRLPAMMVLSGCCTAVVCCAGPEDAAGQPAG
jgi:hypothetical protein